jgi:regulator of RNase E activity RraA
MLVKGDVYVVDQFGAHIDGPTIGDNLGNSIFAKTGNGIVYDGAIRDIDGLKEIGSFTSFFRTYHPSHHLNNPEGELNTTLIGINTPTRIGMATVMPGDVVLGRDGGVIFIPPHLAEKVVKTSEVVRLRDMFGHQRLREEKYTPGQIDSRWSDEIEKDFSKWLNDHIDELPVPRAQIQELLKTRTW